jgi:hypothetical protein
MRVRIQYSVDLDEIPNKISIFLNEVVQGLDETSRSLSGESNSLSKDRVSEDSLLALDQARMELARLDSMLADHQAILGGYIEAKKRPQDPAPPEEPQDVVSEG